MTASTLAGRNYTTVRDTIILITNTDGETDVPASAISQEMAEKLPNKTTPLPFDQTKYAVQLDVFHQLHCLVWTHCINTKSI